MRTQTLWDPERLRYEVWHCTWNRHQAAVCVLLLLWSVISGIALSAIQWTIDPATIVAPTSYSFFLLTPVTGATLITFVAGLLPEMSLTVPLTAILGSLLAMVIPSILVFPIGAAGSVTTKLSPAWEIVLSTLLCLCVTIAFVIGFWALAAQLLRNRIATSDPSHSNHCGRWMHLNPYDAAAWFSVIVVYVVIGISGLVTDIIQRDTPTFMTYIVLFAQTIFPAFGFFISWVGIQDSRKEWLIPLVSFLCSCALVIPELRGDSFALLAILLAAHVLGALVGLGCKKYHQRRSVSSTN